MAWQSVSFRLVSTASAAPLAQAPVAVAQQHSGRYERRRRTQLFASLVFSKKLLGRNINDDCLWMLTLFWYWFSISR